MTTKWVDDILSTLRSWFNQGDDATESEIHAAMQEAGGLDGLKAKIKADAISEANTAHAAEIEKITKEKSDIEDELTSLKSGLAETEGRLAAANSRITELEKRSTAEITKVKSESTDENAGSNMPAWKAAQEYIKSL